MSENLLLKAFPELLAADGTISRLPVGEPYVKNGYLICITPRSGSTFLTHLLRDNLYYGYPDEWFNYDSVPAVIQNGTVSGFDGYLRYIATYENDINKIFGMQLSYPQYHFLNELIPLEGVLGHGFRWFYLTRRDLLLQAVSLYLANTSGIFHDYSFNPIFTGNVDVPYCEDGIRDSIKILTGQETAFEVLFRDRGIEPVRLYYEDIIGNKRKTVMLFRNVLGIDQEILAEDTSSVRKLKSDINQEYAQRFLESNQAYLDAILARRGMS